MEPKLPFLKSRSFIKIRHSQEDTKRCFSLYALKVVQL